MTIKGHRIYKLSLNLSLLLLLTSASIASLKAADSSAKPESEEQQTILPSSEILAEDGWRNWNSKSTNTSCIAGMATGALIGFNPSLTRGTAGVGAAAGNHAFFKNYKNDVAFVGCGALGALLNYAVNKSFKQPVAMIQPSVAPAQPVARPKSNHYRNDALPTLGAAEHERENILTARDKWARNPHLVEDGRPSRFWLAEAQDRLEEVDGIIGKFKKKE